MDIKYIITILFLHFMADFVLQNDKMVLRKSKSLKWLTIHTSIYSLVFIWLVMFLSIEKTLIFMLITFICHTIQDYITSRINSKLYKVSNHWFFVSFGFDQLLHYIQLLFLFQFLLK